MKRSNINIIIAISLVVLSIVTRVLNAQVHFYNIAPILAVGLFSGVIIKDRKYLPFLITLAGQFFADLYFQRYTTTPGFYDGQIVNYIALLSAPIIGSMIKQAKPVAILAGTLGTATAFFIISNFGYFLQGFNGLTLSGFVQTYRDAIPFYEYSIIGNVVGSVVLFGGYFATKYFLEKNMQSAKA